MKAAFISKNMTTQSEALRAGVNLVVHAIDTSLFFLEERLSDGLLEDAEFSVWLEVFQEEMEAPIYTNVPANEKHGFVYLSTEAIAKKLKEFDVLIPL